MENLCQGKPVPALVRFMLPLMAGRLVQIVYNYVDMLIVGQALGMEAFAGIGSTLNVFHLFSGFLLGTANGVGVLIGQRFGGADKQGMRGVLSMGFLFCTFISVLAAALSAFFTDDLLRVMNTPGEIFGYAYRYLLILLVCAPVLVWNFLFTGVLRGVGDNKAPVWYQFISTLCNVGLDLLLIGALNMGTAGAALATILSQWLTVVLCILRILRKHRDLQVSGKDMLPQGKRLWEIVSFGIPMGLQSTVIEMGNVLVQTVTNGLGTEVIAAITAAQRIRAVNMMPFFSLGTAVSVFTAQNYGAGNLDRVKKGIRAGMCVALAASLVMIALNTLFGKQISGLLIPDSPNAVTMAFQYLMVVGSGLFLLGVLLVFRNGMQGMGKKWAPTVSAAAELCVSMLGAFWLIPRLKFWGIAVLNPLAWLLSSIPLVISYAVLQKKLFFAQAFARPGN